MHNVSRLPLENRADASKAKGSDKVVSSFRTVSRFLVLFNDLYLSRETWCACSENIERSYHIVTCMPLLMKYFLSQRYLKFCLLVNFSKFHSIMSIDSTSADNDISALKLIWIIILFNSGIWYLAINVTKDSANYANYANHVWKIY